MSFSQIGQVFHTQKSKSLKLWFYARTFGFGLGIYIYKGELLGPLLFSSFFPKHMKFFFGVWFNF
jgi:hypothetical protein